MTMTTTAQPPVGASVSRDDAPVRAPRLDDRRLAAIGGITFAATVLLTNALQGATPGFDAPPNEVIEYLTERRGRSVFAVAAFAFGALPLMMFASAFYARLRSVARPADLVWARFGMIGALLILPVFALVVVQRLVLLAGIDEIIGSPELVALPHAAVRTRWCSSRAT